MKLIAVIFSFIVIIIYNNSFSKEIDTTQIIHKINLLSEYNYTNLDSAEIIKNDIEKYNAYPKIIFLANNQIAITYSVLGDNLTAYQYFTKNTKLDSSKLDNKSIGSIYTNAGIVNMDIGQFETATQYLFIGLKYR